MIHSHITSRTDEKSKSMKFPLFFFELVWLWCQQAYSLTHAYALILNFGVFTKKVEDSFFTANSFPLSLFSCLVFREDTNDWPGPKQSQNVKKCAFEATVPFIWHLRVLSIIEEVHTARSWMDALILFIWFSSSIETNKKRVRRNPRKDTFAGENPILKCS